MTDGRFSDTLLAWYRENKRDLPWRCEVTPYRTWISEIMLQQTRVEAVKGYFERFLAVLPTVEALASVPDELLMKLWQGLGYYSRARNLKRAALEIVGKHGGALPSELPALLALPGIGRYTAGAIASIAFGKRTPAVDGNVLRVYARVFGDERDIADPRTRAAYEAAVEALMPPESGTYADGQNDCGDFTQGLIELGATVCVPNGRPSCHLCPFASLCASHRDGMWESLPVKSRKAERRIEKRTVVILTDGERFGLTKRPETGLLAGLYEPINLEGELSADEIRERLCALGIDGDAIRSVTPIGDAKHIFTHVEWQMTGYEVRVGHLMHRAEIVFRTLREIDADYAVPSAYRFFVKHMHGTEDARRGGETE